MQATTTREVSLPPRPRQQHARLRALLRNKGATASLAFLIILLLVAVAAPVIAPFDPEEVNIAERLEPPSTSHLMGTDQFGRDVFSRTLQGAQITLWFATAAVLLSTLMGVIPGLVAGYVGGPLDTIVTRLVDVMLAFPGILLALVIVAILGIGLQQLIWAIAISYIPVYVRLVRGSVIATKENVYVEAARQLGCSTARICFRHILPNVVFPVMVTATTAIAWAILSGTALNFIGLGVQPPTPEWGADMADGRNYLRSAWWITGGPGLATMMTIFAVNLLGDWLASSMDPRLRERSG
jgi:peptide/nickel transport system permease protein